MAKQFRRFRFALRFWVAAAFVASPAMAGQNEAPAAVPPPPAAATATEFPLPSFWQGIVGGAGGELFVHITVQAGEAGPQVTITAPRAGAIRAAARAPRIDGGGLSFGLVSRGVEGRFRGEARADGSAYEGTLSLDAGGAEPSTTPFVLERTLPPSSVPDAVRWEGTLEVAGQRLPMSFLIASWTLPGGLSGRSASLDIPIQSLADFPVIVRSGVEEGAIELILPVGTDASLVLRPEGEDRLTGTFAQGPFKGPIELKRVAGASEIVAARPQMPVPPFPYRSREVLIPHRFGHSLAGTLTLPTRTPESPERFPAVVLVSGSGPQDRDETLLGHKPFLVLADALTRAGIAVLRYDDRGIGGSTGSFEPATTHDFATDADEATEWLRRQSEIDATRIGIIGHSEGGIIAPLVASWQWEEPDPSTAVAFIVLLAGPGVPGRELLPVQMRRIAEANGASRAEAEAMAAAGAALIDAILAQAPFEEVQGLARTLIQSQVRLAVGDEEMSPEELDQAIAGAIAQLTNPWMRIFLAHDPRPSITALKIPILAMNGSLDTQVDADQNLAALEAAAKAGGAPLTVKRFEGLNHLFQPAKSGGPEEYAAIEITFDPAAIDFMIDWIKARLAEPRPAPPARTTDAPASSTVPAGVR